MINSTYQDITQQQKALDALKTSEQTFRMLVENIDDIFWIYNSTDKEMKYVGPQENKIMDSKVQDLFTNYESFIARIHPADKKIIHAGVLKILAGKKVNIEYRMFSSDNVIWLLLRSFGQYESSNDKNLIFGLISDITEKKQNERNVLKAILETESREREKFAKELHDALGATLSAIKMSLERLNATDLNQGKRGFYSEHALTLIVQAVNTSREISNNLKPHTLGNFGLIASIEQLCENINKLDGIYVSFNYNDSKIHLDDEIELSIYRILNELVNNSLKYSRAKKAHIEVKLENNKLSLNYKDNGKGFDPKKAISERGSGLKNVISRVKAFGGEIEIKSKINEGMQTMIEIST